MKGTWTCLFSAFESFNIFANWPLQHFTQCMCEATVRGFCFYWAIQFLLENIWPSKKVWILAFEYSSKYSYFQNVTSLKSLSEQYKIFIKHENTGHFDSRCPLDHSAFTTSAQYNSNPVLSTEEIPIVSFRCLQTPPVSAITSILCGVAFLSVLLCHHSSKSSYWCIKTFITWCSNQVSNGFPFHCMKSKALTLALCELPLASPFHQPTSSSSVHISSRAFVLTLLPDQGCSSPRPYVIDRLHHSDANSKVLSPEGDFTPYLTERL